MQAVVTPSANLVATDPELQLGTYRLETKVQ